MSKMKQRGSPHTGDCASREGALCTSILRGCLLVAVAPQTPPRIYCHCIIKILISPPMARTREYGACTALSVACSCTLAARVAPVTPVLCRLRCSSGLAKQAPEQAPACVSVSRAPAQPPAVVTMASNKRSAGAAGHVGGGAGSPSGPSQSGAKRQRQAAAPEKSAYVCWLAVRQARQSQTPIWWCLCVRVHAFVLEQVPGRVGGRGRQGFRPYVMAPPCPCAV